MLNLYKSVAASMGMGITTAMNGREALDMLQLDEGFSLIITDMNMPVMDGIEFTRQLRMNQAFADVPVIMITTESERSQQDIARKAGVTDFMQKPFAVEKLQEKIKACLVS
jgi:CheY-like chemotaxis protein